MLGNGIDEALTADQPAEVRPAAIAEPPIPAPPAARQAQRWDFLNQYDFRRYGNAAFSLVRSRPTDAGESSPGYAISGGEAVLLWPGPFVLGGSHDFELRLVPDDAFSLALSRYQLESGVRLGPLEPMVRVGFTTLHVDVGHGLSFGLFSPRVGAGLWLSLGGSRLGVSAFSEYFWRWLGDESAFVHGLTLELQVSAPPR